MALVFNNRVLAFFQSLGERPCLLTPESEYSYNALYEALQLPTRADEQNATFGWLALVHLLQSALHDKAFSFSPRVNSASGLWLQTTGTTGEPKWVHHPWESWLRQYRWKDGGEKRVLQVMAFDHIGGLHSIFSALSRGMTLVVPLANDGTSVREALHNHQVFLLPTTPAHLALLLQSGCFNDPLPHLRLISYGAEAMSPALKNSITSLQPHIRWRETYGSTETGILPLQSGSNPGCWQPSFAYKIIESELHVQNLIGDWVPTGDLVEDLGGGKLHFLGRKSMRVKVGGVMVSPEQTAAWLRNQPGVWQAAVEVVPNLLLGQVFEARIWAASNVEPEQLEQALRKSFPAYFLKEALPVRYRFEEMKVNRRMKNEG